MLKRRVLAPLAIPLLAGGLIAIVLAARHHDGPDAAVSESPGTAAGAEAGTAAITQSAPTLQARLTRLSGILRDLEEQSAPASARELQHLTEQLASTTAIIRDAAPGSLVEPHPADYFRVTVASLGLLERIEVAPSADAALVSARGIAEFGRDTVAQYLIDTQREVTRQPDDATQLTGLDPA